AYDASALGVTDSAVPICAMPDDGADTIGTAPSLMCRKRSCSACSAPGFLDFQHHRFAERLEGRLDLVEARGVIEPEQTIDGFAIPAETTHQLGAGDTALTQRAIERGLERRHQRQRHRPAARSFGSRRDVLAAGPGGWRVIGSPPVRFRRAGGMLPLPMPRAGGSIEELASFFNLPSNDFVLVVAWLLATLRAGGPYPVLAISGEQG